MTSTTSPRTLPATPEAAAGAGASAETAEPSPRAASATAIALVVIAVVATLFALRWAKPVPIPILMGVLLSYAIGPAANVLERWRVPRMAGAALVLSALLAVVGWGAWALSYQVDELLESVPSVTAKLREAMQRRPATESTLRKVERAVAEIEAATQPVSEPAASAASAAGAREPAAAAETAARAAAPPARIASAAPPRPASERIDVRAYLLSGSIGALVFLGQLVAMLFITLFLVGAGTAFRRKMVRIAGPQLSRKKVTIATLNEIDEQIQRYLLLQVAMSMLVGAVTWLVFWLIGLNQAAVWGVIAALTNLIPYLGAVVVGAGASVAAFAQFGTLEMAVLVCAASFGIRTVNGNLLGPWLMGRTSRIHPVVVFVTVLVFAWLWGVWGLLLGVPVLVVLKTVCDRVEGLKPLGELLAE